MSETDSTVPRVSPRISPTMMMILHGREIEKRAEDRLRGLGMSLRKVGLLGHLRQEPRISYSALARRAGIRVQSLQPIVDSLVGDGFIRAVGGVGQGRAAVIELTARGERALEAAMDVIASLDRELFTGAVWTRLGDALAEVGREHPSDRQGDDPLSN